MVPETPTNFHREIARLLHCLGDATESDNDTVVFLESVIRKQFLNVMKEAYEVAVEHNKRYISNYELIYLMHKKKNLYKLKRLHNFQLHEDKMEKMAHRKRIKELVGDAIVVYDQKGLARKKERTHIKIIRKLNGHVNPDGSVRGHCRREVKALKTTEIMTNEKYKPYQNAKCITFRPNKDYTMGLDNVKNWIDPQKTYKATYSAMEVLCFIGYETVADIVEAVFITRKSKNDPVACSVTPENSGAVSAEGPIKVNEVNEVLSKYFTRNYWLNDLFFQTVGVDYLASMGM